MASRSGRAVRSVCLTSLCLSCTLSVWRQSRGNVSGARPNVALHVLQNTSTCFCPDVSVPSIVRHYHLPPSCLLMVFGRLLTLTADAKPKLLPTVLLYEYPRPKLLLAYNRSTPVFDTTQDV